MTGMTAAVFVTVVVFMTVAAALDVGVVFQCSRKERLYCSSAEPLTPP